MKMHDNRNQNMDSSFYQDERAQYASQSQNTRKRPETLDLNKQPAKKPRFNQSLTTPAVLNSPDVQKLSMATPDIEKFIISHSTLQTPTPSLVFPHTVKATTEQEDYARGFEVALNNLRQNEHMQQQQTTVEYTSTGPSISVNPAITTSPPTSSGILSMNGGSITYTNLDENYPATIKEEPQTVPNSPPMSPIDMESQEKIKLERKRQRNRVAASKCRKRKLERISKLEDKVKILKGENTELGSIIKALKENVCQLKQQVIDHMSKGCSIPAYNVPYFNKGINDSDMK